MASSFYDNEKVLVDRLSECLNLCVVQGVPDYWWVVQYGAAFAKSNGPGSPRAGIYVFYAGERVKSDPCCSMTTQLWCVAVVTVNRCSTVSEPGFLARIENGKVVDDVIRCMRDCDNECAPWVRSNVPQFPIPLDDNGVISTFLAFEKERVDA
jgi:hypothetical protein